ncbi:hypothetical protein CDAR_399871 [Caerostris darwini]|uniref:Uncharacterized protein n=1 Tax=Caerostris darwini TaxID=1538125 RepID=A0AAV4S5N1_9ARAC|nr:hypothetical protein CDAR_399871 [Caerostris darwini]
MEQQISGDLGVDGGAVCPFYACRQYLLPSSWHPSSALLAQKRESSLEFMVYLCWVCSSVPGGEWDSRFQCSEVQGAIRTIYPLRRTLNHGLSVLHIY